MGARSVLVALRRRTAWWNGSRRPSATPPWWSGLRKPPGPRRVRPGRY